VSVWRTMWMVCVLALTMCGDVPSLPIPAGPSVLGLNGRWLQDTDRYWLPMDHEGRGQPLWEPWREAMAIHNTGDAPLRIHDIWLERSPSVFPEEFELVAPQRATERPLDATNITLAPGSQLDFDVRFAPSVAGTRDATLVVRHDAGADIRVSLSGLGKGQAELVSTGHAKGLAPGPGLSFSDVAWHNGPLVGYMSATVHGPAGAHAVVAAVSPHGALRFATGHGLGRVVSSCLVGDDIVLLTRTEPGPGAESLAARFDHDGHLLWRVGLGPLDSAHCVADADVIMVAAIERRSETSQSLVLALEPSTGSTRSANRLTVSGQPLTTVDAVGVAAGRWLVAGRSPGGSVVVAFEEGRPLSWVAQVEPAVTHVCGQRGSDTFFASGTTATGLTVTQFSARDGGSSWTHHFHAAQLVGLSPYRRSESPELSAGPGSLDAVILAQTQHGPTLTRLRGHDGFPVRHLALRGPGEPLIGLAVDAGAATTVTVRRPSGDDASANAQNAAGPWRWYRGTRLDSRLTPPITHLRMGELRPTTTPTVSEPPDAFAWDATAWVRMAPATTPRLGGLVQVVPL
jgi:hypothetical protein